MKFRPRVIFTIFKRNFASYFSGILGYLFIIVFVVAGGALAFSAQFFTANEPNLDQLTQWYPLLLLFIVPAITMSVWADERKLGTDEILFTLPATDLEVLLGKYFAVLAVYSVALLFSAPYVIVLMVLGVPDWGRVFSAPLEVALAMLGSTDWGLIFTTYFGYWIAGAALLGAGMLASILTRSLTVAFVLGVIICGMPVFVQYLGDLTGFTDLFSGLSLSEQFRDLGMGMIPISGLMYFLSFTVFTLYLNLVLVKKRHWSSGRSIWMGLQYLVRSACLAVILICVTAWFGYTALRVDATSERLFSLSPLTRQVLGKLNAKRPIEIQAYLSPEVPREYVDTRKQLVGLLRQFDQLGGSGLEVRYVDVAPFSKEEDEAEHFGIERVQVTTERDGRRSEADVFLGAVVISSYDKVVVPFFGKGLPIEYELTRSVQTVTRKERHKLGVLTTDAGLISGSREWQIVTELKKQYEVEEVSPTEIDADKFDALLAVMPSSLTDMELDNLVEHVTAGHPVLIFDDPFPLVFSTQFGVTSAPRQAKPNPGGQFAMFGGGQQAEPKADGGRATRLLEALDIRWQYDRVVFDDSNAHPQFGMLPKEYVFITRDNGNPKAFDPDSRITKGLQELIVLYAGTVERGAADDKDVKFQPLLTTGRASGLLAWDEFVRPGFSPLTFQETAQPMQILDREVDDRTHVVAARITADKEGKKRNAIFVADVDMISDFFFQERNERNLGDLNIEFDNVSFVLNAIDALVGDDTFIDLRSRRARHRTLQLVDANKRRFFEDANKAEVKAGKEADKELERRRKQLDERVDEIRNDPNLDPVAKSQMVLQAERAEQQRLSLAEAQIEQRKNEEVRKIRANTNRQEMALESYIRMFVIAASPLPAVLLGAAMLIYRLIAEQSTVGVRRRPT